MTDNPEKSGGYLFIVDNANNHWKVQRYLHDWCDIACALDIATGYFEIGALLALDAHPAEDQEAFRFLLATALHKAGKFEQLNVAEVDGRWHYTFSGVGEAVSKPPGLNVANPDACRVRTDDAIYHSCLYSCFVLR